MTEYRLLPGFSQTAGAWDAVCAVLPASARARPLDIHARRSFEETARAFVPEGPGVWAGYSMGGRLALWIALEHPELVEALALISTNPGINDDRQRLARRDSDEELAGFIESSGRDAFFDRWLAQPLFSGLDPVAARQHRLTSAPELASQLRTLGQGAQQSMWDRLPELSMPVTVIAGARDERYAAIAGQTAADIGSNGELHLVPGAGHALLQEAPAAVASILSAL